MSSSEFAITVEHLASRLAAEHEALARAWLDRLHEIVDLPRDEVFPSRQLLDHIPELIAHIAAYLRAPADHEIAADTAVMAKATELGLMRFDQRASVHQLLREYQLFSEVIEDFFAREAATLAERADATAAVLVLSRAQQAVRVLQRQTVDAFITSYTETIERQTAQLRSFSRLVSHEIRQPLGVLQVLTRVIQPPPGDSEGQRLVDTLERNVVRLADVAGKLERLARLTRRHESAPNEQHVDLGALVHDVARQLQDMADARGVRFEIADTLPSLLADAGRIELVVMNLLANAVKYSDPAKAVPTVRVTADPTVLHARLIVTDNGIGIPRSKLDLIFDQFVRVHAHLDDELGAQGMGLGLSIVRECMEAMGGRITVESEEYVGTRFTLDWPTEPPAER